MDKSEKDITLEVLYKLKENIAINASVARSEMRKAMNEIEDLEKVIQKVKRLTTHNK